jgi:hypothetical protein
MWPQKARIETLAAGVPGGDHTLSPPQLEELVYPPQPEEESERLAEEPQQSPMKPIRRSRIKPESGILCLGHH